MTLKTRHQDNGLLVYEAYWTAETDVPLTLVTATHLSEGFMINVNIMGLSSNSGPYIEKNYQICDTVLRDLLLERQFPDLRFGPHYLDRRI